MGEKKRKKAPAEKPISLHPLSLKEALGALLATKPPLRKKRGKEEGQNKKPSSK